jgi:hypothetical protein
MRDSTRFNYVRYDESAQIFSNAAKDLSVNLENFIEDALNSSRAKALALTKLEECYAWIGKAIRDDQIAARKGDLQEERTDR